MQAHSLFAGRSLGLSYWNAEARIVDADRIQLEQHLKRLGDVKVTAVKSLEETAAKNCDLLIIAAQKVPTKDFAQWLTGLKGRVQAHGNIWVPALILADVGFELLSDILPEITKENWYFDILAPAHMTSLPMRVANLIRIHDHLHELKRYSAAVEDISLKVTMLESQMKDLRAVEKKS